MTCRLVRARAPLFVALLTLLGAAACGRVEGALTPEATRAAARAAAQETDGWIAEELAASTFADADGWLDRQDHVLLEGDAGAVRGLIGDLRAAGAEGLYFVSIEELGGLRVSTALAVQMPSSPASRDRLLRREAQFWGTGRPGPDVGQRYLAFTFD